MTQYSFLIESNAYMQESLLGDLWEKGKHKFHKVKNAIKKGYKTGDDFVDAGKKLSPKMAKVDTALRIGGPLLAAKKEGLKSGLAMALGQEAGRAALKTGVGVLTRAQVAKELKKARRERDC